MTKHALAVTTCGDGEKDEAGSATTNNRTTKKKEVNIRFTKSPKAKIVEQRRESISPYRKCQIVNGSVALATPMTLAPCYMTLSPEHFISENSFISLQNYATLKLFRQYSLMEVIAKAQRKHAERF
jgi:hypothetical protein